MKDIETEQEVHTLVKHFYDKALADEVIAYIFKDHMESELEEHIPVISDFWSSVLLGTQKYKGNVMLAHISLNNKVDLKEAHFDQWLKLWMESCNELFEGEKVEEAKKRAVMMKNLMLFKIQQSSKDGFIQ